MSSTFRSKQGPLRNERRETSGAAHRHVLSPCRQQVNSFDSHSNLLTFLEGSAAGPTCMAVTRGSAKRSSCCPSTSNGAPGSHSNAAEGNQSSTLSGTGATEEGNHTNHHRGGQRQSKRPALVDRTNNGLPTTAAGSSMIGHMALCPSEAQSMLSGSGGEASGASTVQVPSHMNGLQAVRGKQVQPCDAAGTNMGSAHSGGLTVRSSGAVTQAVFNSTGGPGGSAQSRVAPKRNVSGTRGRSKARGSSSSVGVGSRRRRSDGGQGASSKPGLEKMCLSSGGTSGFLPMVAAMDCDSQSKDPADRDIQELENDDAQRLLLTDETLTSCSDGLGTDSGSVGRSELGLIGLPASAAPVRGGLHSSSQEHGAKHSWREDVSVGPAVDAGRDSSACSSGIQLLAVQEDLGTCTQPTALSSSVTAGELSAATAFTSGSSLPSLPHHWKVATANRCPEASGMSLSQQSDSQETSWSTGPSSACLLSVPHPSLGGAALASAQDRLQGSAVQAPERDMASLLRDAECWQISSIRQNRGGGAPDEWISQQSEHLGLPQILRGDVQGMGPQPSVSGAPLPQQCGSRAEGRRPLSQAEPQMSLRSDRVAAAGGRPIEQCEGNPAARGHHVHLLHSESLLAVQPGQDHNFQSQPSAVTQPLGSAAGCQVFRGLQSGQAAPAVGIPPLYGGFVGSNATQGSSFVGPCFSQHMDIDGNHTDPQLCAAYAVDIFQHLKASELRRRPKEGYMETVQSDINEQMRGILIDWLVEVAEEYKLVADTLYLTCSFIDRYLSTTMVTRGRLQLLGVSCMLIASKYEEIYAPQVDEFCYITDNTYRREEVIEMERAVLKELHFELSYPTTKSFLRRFIRAAQADLPVPNIQLELLGNYFAELTLVDYNCLKFLPSMVAASAVFLAKRTLWPEAHPWTPTLQHYSSYMPSQLQECTLNLHDLHTNRKGCTLPAIREKYRQAKFQHVASIPPCPELPASLFVDSPTT